MIGGDSDAVESARPIFEACGGTIVHQGGPGAGQKTKIVNQILVAASMIGACEAILFAVSVGIITYFHQNERKTVSPMMRALLDRILVTDDETAMGTVKGEEAMDSGVNTPRRLTVA